MSYYSSTLGDGKCTILETQDVLPIHPDEVAAYLKYDHDYNQSDLIMEIVRATEVLEAKNCYALIPKKIKFTHSNPNIPLPLGPVSQILVYKKYKHRPEEQIAQAYLEERVYANSYSIEVLKNALTADEYQACGLAPNPRNLSTYYKESRMSFIVEYWAGLYKAPKTEPTVSTLVGGIQKEYTVRTDVPGVFLHRLCTLLKDGTDSTARTHSTTAPRISVVHVSRNTGNSLRPKL